MNGTTGRIVWRLKVPAQEGHVRFASQFLRTQSILNGIGKRSGVELTAG
jgi:hypothetical protein